MKTKATKRVAAKSIREINVATYAKKTARYAVKKAAKKNVSVTVAKAGKVYRLHPDGKKVLVMDLPQKIKVKHSIIKIAD
ncbi:MAG TPA: hypothetical protein VIM65_02395 [Cyclobacteriaceae bacterium]